ncbi:MAG: hypothetical protein J0I36_08825, partial [Pandoraea sp.]|nr:hypothetical protein [Pandoraea sp.]
MQVGSIVKSNHIAVPQGAMGIVTRVLGDMAMVRWYSGQPGASKELNTEPFFIVDLIEPAHHPPHRQATLDLELAVAAGAGTA